MSNIPLVKINQAASTQNLYRNLNRDDRIALQSQPLSNNYTGSAKGLVGTLTPIHFQALDIGRDKYATLSQMQNCEETCVQSCILANNDPYQCNRFCHEKCVDETTKDYI
jgi:hypothetical protein